MITVEFFGLSRTGKTTQIDLLVRHLEYTGARYLVQSRPEVSFANAGSLEMFHELMFETIFNSYEISCQDEQEFLILDRGFHDRYVLLDADYESGLIQIGFYQKMIQRLNPFIAQEDKYALLMMTDPSTSLERVAQQIEDGLDYSGLCNGMNIHEGERGLTLLCSLYQDFARKHPHVQVINCSGSIPSVQQQIVNALPFYNLTVPIEL